MSFQLEQKKQQTLYLERPEFQDMVGIHDRTFQFLPEYKSYNLYPPHRESIVELFEHADPLQKIQWHRYAGHGCSSQTCCLNFLYPLAQDLDLLAKWVEYVIGGPQVTILPIEERHGLPRYIAFEWFPPTDYLNESKGGVKSRGAHSTSVDAAIKYQVGSQIRLLLIEWKYTESYANVRASDSLKGDTTRNQRYHNLWRRPHGPLNQQLALQLSDFYLEPWYQLLRQQMLAYHVELDPLSEYEHAMVVHISPSNNSALRKVRGERFQAYAQQNLLEDNTFQVFSHMIATPWKERFQSLSTEEAFMHSLSDPHYSWLLERYPDLF